MNILDYIFSILILLVFFVGFVLFLAVVVVTMPIWSIALLIMALDDKKQHEKYKTKTHNSNATN